LSFTGREEKKKGAARKSRWYETILSRGKRGPFPEYLSRKPKEKEKKKKRPQAPFGC